MQELHVTRPGSLMEKQLSDSLAAIHEIRECYRVLKKGGLNVVGEVLKGQGPFYEMEHYPKDDVYDQETASQYYYHAHREDHAEHGHFHLFLRNGALPEEAKPLMGPVAEDRVAHLIAISMDAWGYPTDLFTVNRWVTDESWLPAEVVAGALDRFAIDHAHPSWPVNRWLTAMVRCFRPQIETLLYHRDEVINQRRAQGLKAVLEDRSLEIIGAVPVDVESWAVELEAEQRKRQDCYRRLSVTGH
ncbi:hypothetical protein A8B84_06560 [Marinobacter sp. EhC06]|nr:hypothetical protein A8B80_04770 [Marinobacter sp. EhN04]OAN91270.1 hypothetical protein A8B84_06560 [Marinobacter sp. EhC06]